LDQRLPALAAKPTGERAHALLAAGDEVDDLLTGLSDRRPQQSDDRGRRGGKTDREHHPVDQAVAALLAAEPLRPVEKPDPECVEHGTHLLMRFTRCGQESGESRRRATARAPPAAAPAARASPGRRDRRRAPGAAPARRAAPSPAGARTP